MRSKRQSSGGSCDSSVEASAESVRYDGRPPGAPSVTVAPLDGKILGARSAVCSVPSLAGRLRRRR